MEKKEKKDVYQLVTDKIIAKMEEGVVPWHKPWFAVGGTDVPINYITRRPYSGVNLLLLEEPGEYLTMKQANAAGGHIKKGEHPSLVVFYDMIPTKEKELDDNGNVVGEKVTSKYPMLRYYNVWHISQCEGIESRIKETPEGEKLAVEPLEAGDKVINGYKTREGEREGSIFTLTMKPSNEAYYRPSTDSVVIPELRQYEVVEEFYSTAFHEMVHSTGHSSRLNRSGVSGVASFGDSSYSKEELVAEIGSAMLCQTVGISCDRAFNNSVAYLQSWLKRLKDDKKMIVTAAGQAEKAARYILGEK